MSISQSFQKNITRRYNQPRLQFVHDSNNFEDHVIKVSRIRRDVGLTAGTATVTLNNGTGLFNYFKSDGVSMGGSAQVKVYQSGDPSDVVTYFSGTVADVQYKGAQCIAHIQDKIGENLDRPLGSGWHPLIYTRGGGYTVDEIVYRILVEAGLDSEQSTANTDIDWNSLQSWGDNYLSVHDYNIECQFTGQNVGWALLMIAGLSSSYIYANIDDKIAFAPPYGSGFSYNETNSKINMDLSTKDLINKMLVRYGYNMVTDEWLSHTGFDVNDASFARYGKELFIEESRVIWHLTIESAQSDLDVTLPDRAVPIKYFDITTGLYGMIEELGNEITVSDTLLRINSQVAYIEEINADFENRTVKLRAKAPPGAPEVVGPPAALFNDVVVDGMFMYAAYEDSTEPGGGVIVFDVSNLENPYRIGHLNISSTTAKAPKRIRKYKDWVYTSFTDGVRAVGVVDPTDPEIGSIALGISGGGTPTVAVTHRTSQDVFVWWQSLNTGLWLWEGTDGTDLIRRDYFAQNYTHYDEHVGGMLPNTDNSWYQTPSSGHVAVFATRDWVVSDGGSGVYSATTAGGIWKIGVDTIFADPQGEGTYDIITRDRGPELHGVPLAHAGKNVHLYSYQTTIAGNSDYAYCYTMNHVNQVHTNPGSYSAPGNNMAKFEIDKYSAYGYIIGLMGCAIINLATAEVVHTITGTFRGHVVKDNFLYIAETTRGIEIYDVTDATNPVLVSRAT